eukprot:jgi/Chrzof1/14/Cz01g00150.t1
MPCVYVNPTRSAGVLPEDLAFVRGALERHGSRIPDNFQPTAPAYNPGAGPKRYRGAMPKQAYQNPQTVAFLHMLGLHYNLDHAAASQPSATFTPAAVLAPAAAAPNPEEIDLDGDDDDDDDDDDGDHAGEDDVDNEHDAVDDDQDADAAGVPVYDPVNSSSLDDPDAAGAPEDALFSPTDMNFNRLTQQQPQQ